MANLISFFDPKIHSLIVLAATAVASASAIAKALELMVAALSALWPKAAKANGPLTSAIAFLGRIQSMPILQGLALSPRPGAPSHPIVAQAPGGAGVNLPSPKGFGLLAFLCLSALPARAQVMAPATPSTGSAAAAATPSGASTLRLPTLGAIDWKTVVFSHGPSLPLIEINPRNPHPIEVAPGAGYSAGACFGQLEIGSVQTSLLCASGQAFLSVISPAGEPEGAVKIALMLGTLGNLIALGPLLTPWTASGGGFLQLGRPGTSWVASIDPVRAWHLLGGS